MAGSSSGRIGRIVKALPLDGVERGLHRCGIAQVQLHAAYIGLVRDSERVQLQDDRVSHLLRGFQCLLLGDRNPRFDRGNVVGLQQLLGLVLGQDGAAGLPHIVDNSLGLAELQRRVLRHCWRFVDRLQVVSIPPHVVEGAHRAVREPEYRNAGLVQDLLASCDLSAAHPARQHRLAESLGVRLQLLRDYAAVITLRLREPGLHRPFRAWGYPVTTLLALAGSLVFLVASIHDDPASAARTAVLLAAALPILRIHAMAEGAAHGGITRLQ